MNFLPGKKYGVPSHNFVKKNVLCEKGDEITRFDGSSHFISVDSFPFLFLDTFNLLYPSVSPNQFMSLVLQFRFTSQSPFFSLAQPFQVNQINRQFKTHVENFLHEYYSLFGHFPNRFTPKRKSFFQQQRVFKEDCPVNHK